MSDWTAVYQFPIDKDLRELAQFIARSRLPLRISEENNQQVLWGPDPRFKEMLLPLLEHWNAGQIALADVRIEPVTADAAGAGADPGEGDQPQHSAAEAGPEAGSAPGTGDVGRADAVGAAPLPSWPLVATPLSLLLIGLCFAGWLLLRENLAQGLVIFPDRRQLFDWAGSTLAWHWSSGEYWRLWSPVVVHFSLPHALFNALGVWILGRSLEARAGTLPLAVLVLVSAAVSNLAQYFWSPETVFGGMSGVVYALVGAVLVLQRLAPDWNDVPRGVVTVAVAWLLICASGLFTLVFGVGVANAAHLGGFVCGVLLTLVYALLGGTQNFSSVKTKTDPS
ncbi:rhomboid protease GlpG [Microbulbifer aestuariivivens]|uniref:Rhomboid protease GlpG n=1 Tax=Microbulbifer aestuariivivens TaxID=1908308 RepID=A0ABP9WSH2_9GAMM